MNIKRMKIILTATALTLVTACSKKDNAEPSVPLSKDALLGKWNIISNRTIKSTGETVLSDNTNTDFANSYFDFRNNDSVYQRDKTDYDTSHYAISNSQIILTRKMGNPNISNVLQLTKSKLVVSETFEDEYMGQPISYQYIYTFNR